MSSYEIWVSNPLGERIALVDQVISLSAVRVVNSVGTIVLALPTSFDHRLLALDGIVEVWRAPEGGIQHLETAAFIRKWVWSDTGGIEQITITCTDAVDLLARRIVAYPAGSSQAQKSGIADDVMKAIVRENLGSLAGTGRDVSSIGFSVGSDLGLGPAITRGFSRCNVLQVLQSISEATMLEPTPVYFDVVPRLISDQRMGFEFRTYLNQRGVRQVSGVVFGKEFGNINDPVVELDRREELNFVQAAGEGQGDARVVFDLADTARIGLSPWNRREGYTDARGEGAANITAKAKQALDNGCPQMVMTGEVVDGPYSVYGRDWGFGDVVPVSAFGFQFDGHIRAVRLQINPDGTEAVSARVVTIPQIAEGGGEGGKVGA